jgi:hypothetical protein
MQSKNFVSAHLGKAAEVFGTLDDYPPGHHRFFMKKALI